MINRAQQLYEETLGHHTVLINTEQKYEIIVPPYNFHIMVPLFTSLRL
jgi:hypothetical protein